MTECKTAAVGWCEGSLAMPEPAADPPPPEIWFGRMLNETSLKDPDSGSLHNFYFIGFSSGSASQQKVRPGFASKINFFYYPFDYGTLTLKIKILQDFRYPKET